MRRARPEPLRDWNSHWGRSRRRGSNGSPLLEVAVVVILAVVENVLAVVEASLLAPARGHAFDPPVDFAVGIARNEGLERRNGRLAFTALGNALAALASFAFLALLSFAVGVARLERIDARHEMSGLLQHDGLDHLDGFDDGNARGVYGDRSESGDMLSVESWEAPELR